MGVYRWFALKLIVTRTSTVICTFPSPHNPLQCYRRRTLKCSSKISKTYSKFRSSWRSLNFLWLMFFVWLLRHETSEGRGGHVRNPGFCYAQESKSLGFERWGEEGAVAYHIPAVWCSKIAAKLRGIFVAEQTSGVMPRCSSLTTREPWDRRTSPL